MSYMQKLSTKLLIETLARKMISLSGVAKTHGRGESMLIDDRLRPFLPTAGACRRRSAGETAFAQGALILIAGLILATTTQAATLTASVDRNKISVNETLGLQLRYDEKVAGDQLDLGTLKQDFDVLGLRPQNSSSMSWINGKSTREDLTIWTITLAPRREGTLVIPSFNIDGNVSDAIRIDVAKASATVPREQPIIVRLSPDVNRAHPGQQILIKVELLAHNSVGSLSGDQLRLDGAEVELLDQQSFRKIENGVSWQIVEWTYAVFPERAGTLAIPAQLFSGIIQTASQRNRFDPFQQRGQRISARSSATTIEVQKTPETNGLPWFPATDVVIQSSWSGDTSQMRVGEPLTRTIQIVASGQRSSVIPSLPEGSSLTYKAYRDQPQLENRPAATGMIGVRRESEAIVPSAEGLLELPERRISWWNANSRTWQDAILPAETFDVLPALKNTGFAPPNRVPQFLPTQDGGNPTIVEEAQRGWKIAVVVLGLICLLQLWLLMTPKRHRKDTDKDTGAVDRSPNKAWQELQKALKSGQASTVRKALLSWSQVAAPRQRIPGIQSLANYLDGEDSENLRVQLGKLDESLYKGDTDLDIGVLARAIDRLKARLERRPEKTAGLAPLYPV